MESFFSVAALSALLLAFKPTRVIGAVGLTLLAVAYTLLTIGALAIAGVAYLVWRHK